MLLQSGPRLREVWQGDFPESWSVSDFMLFGEDLDDNHESNAELDCGPILRLWRLDSHSAIRRSRTMTNKINQATKWSGSCTWFSVPVLQPSSLVYAAWCTFCVFVLWYDLISVSMGVFRRSFQNPWELEALGCLYWTADICLSFITAVYIRGELRMDTASIARSYIRRWFIFDAVLLLQQWVIFIYFAVAGSGAHASAVPRLIKLLRLAKAWRYRNILLGFSSSFLINSILRSAFYLLAVFCWVHVSACAFYFLGSRNDEGWVSTWSEDKGLDTYPLNYMVSLQWAASQLQGETDITPNFSAHERGFVAVHVLFSVVLLSMLFGKLTSILNSLEMYRQRRHQLEHAALRYLHKHKITSDLANRVRHYIEWKQKMDASNGEGVSERELMLNLPVELRREVLEESRKPIAMRSPILHALSELAPSVNSMVCCDAFAETNYAPQDFVFSFGTLCKHMYFAVKGTSMYLRYSLILRALLHHTTLNWNMPHFSTILDRYWATHGKQVSERECACEAALWVPWAHTGDWRAQSHFTALVLDVQMFGDIIGYYPLVQRPMKAHAHLVLKALCDVDISDFFSSLDLPQFQRFVSYAPEASLRPGRQGSASKLQRMWSTGTSSYAIRRLSECSKG